MSQAAVAHLEQVIAYLSDPTQAPHKNPPRPPNADVACELMAASTRMIAVMLDRLLTGELHFHNPCPDAVMAACELAEKGLDGNLTPDDCEEVARRFGWKGGGDCGNHT